MGHFRRIFVAGAVALTLLSAAQRALAQGGPPLLTDDPDTPGPGYWEINIATRLGTTRSEHRIEAPLADINYGVGRRIQLKVEIPWLLVREREESFQSGAGNTLVGVKWRFLGQEGKRLAWSTYPQVEFNTGHSAAARGLVERGWQLLLPTEFTFQAGPMELNGEIGVNFLEHGEHEQIFGVSTELTLHSRFELLGELHGENRGIEPADLIVNVGGRQKLTRQIILMMAAGTAVHGVRDERTRLLIYLGLQFNVPSQFDFSQMFRGPRR